MKKIKNNKGYIGIEVVLMAGMIIAFGAVAITNFRQSSISITEDSLEQVGQSIEDMHINTKFD